MPLWAMLIAIPGSGFVSAALNRRSTSWFRAMAISTSVALLAVVCLSVWFGHEVRSSDEDPVVGLILYIIAPAIGTASVLGAVIPMGRRSKRQSDAAFPRGICGVITWAVVLCVVATFAAVAGFSAGLQVT